jgi:transposase
MSRCPIFDVRPSLGLPAVECCRGTRPSQAAKSRPRLKVAIGGAKASIAEAASRPSMRFVAVKSEEQQAQAMLFRTRDLLVWQRTQLVNALRGHLAEHGINAPQGLAKVKRLAAALQGTTDDPLHPLVRELGQRYLDHVARLDVEIAELEKRLRRLSRDNERSARLQTMPGMGPITAAAIDAFAPPMATFRRGRDFAAWLGLVPRQHSTAGKPRLGPDVKDGTA